MRAQHNKLCGFESLCNWTQWSYIESLLERVGQPGFEGAGAKKILH